MFNKHQNKNQSLLHLNGYSFCFKHVSISRVCFLKDVRLVCCLALPCTHFSFSSKTLCTMSFLSKCVFCPIHNFSCSHRRDRVAWWLPRPQPRLSRDVIAVPTSLSSLRGFTPKQAGGFQSINSQVPVAVSPVNVTGQP